MDGTPRSAFLAEDDTLYPTARAASFIGVTADTMRRWGKDHTGPPRVRVNGQYRYPLSGLRQFVDERVSSS